MRIYCTNIELKPDEVIDADKLASHLSTLDATFTYKIMTLSEKPHLVIYSSSANQAKARAQWITSKTKILQDRPYLITVNNPRAPIKSALSLQEMENKPKP